MGNIKKVPLRKCIGCNEMKNKKEMMRVLKTPEGEITLDVTGRKNLRSYMFFSYPLPFTFLFVFNVIYEHLFICLILLYHQFSDCQLFF